MAIVKQRYLCEGEELLVEYKFNKVGLIVEFNEIKDVDTFLSGDNDLVLPKVEVTEESFERIKKKLRRW